eukprot:TRINITY_DN12180_c0_g2_i1.p1 TRINITY_DN12180_c0_g2~~TRINITY_DN12180_c0_g2_i1.p1  ORF type:complete len:291 (+),score=34.64 TRINITY_DN12180_c0_g2_i1:160-1032(+)
MSDDVTSLALLVLVQMVVWWYIYDERSIFIKPIMRLVKANPKWKENVIAHMVKDYSAYGVSDPSVMVYYFALLNVGAPFHHTLGALFCFLGYYYGSAGLFRFGLTFEIGEDVMHYCQMLVTFLSPPGKGIVPWKDSPKAMWGFIGLHHLIGVGAGTIGYLYTSDWMEVQLYTTVLLACLLPHALKVPLQVLSAPSAKPSSAGKAYACIDLFSFCVMIYCRAYIAIPMGWQLTARAQKELSPLAGKYVGIILLIVAPMFFVASIVLFIPNVINGLRHQFGSASDRNVASSS